MDFRTIVVSWIVGLGVVAGALYFVSAEKPGYARAGVEYLGTRAPVHDGLPQPGPDVPADAADAAENG
jgi:hypothetical protein